MKNKLQTLIVALCVCPLFAGAQEVDNMVLNPGFEEYEKCPEGYTFMDQSHRLIPHILHSPRPTISTSAVQAT